MLTKGLLVTERDRRKQTTDRGRVAGEVVVRREHSKDEGRRGKEDTEGLVIDKKEVLAKKPDQKLKWATKAFHLVAKGTLNVTALYDILAHPKFASALSKGIGRQARSLVDANIHLFSTKQQKYLQSDACKWSSFETEAGEDSGAEKDETREPSDTVPSGVAQETADTQNVSEAAAAAGSAGADNVAKTKLITFWQKKKTEEGPQFNAFDSAEAPVKKGARGVGASVAQGNASGDSVNGDAIGSSDTLSANPLQVAKAAAQPGGPAAKGLWLPANAAAAKEKAAQQHRQGSAENAQATQPRSDGPPVEEASQQADGTKSSDAAAPQAKVGDNAQHEKGAEDRTSSEQPVKDKKDSEQSGKDKKESGKSKSKSDKKHRSASRERSRKRSRSNQKEKDSAGADADRKRRRDKSGSRSRRRDSRSRSTRNEKDSAGADADRRRRRDRSGSARNAKDHGGADADRKRSRSTRKKKDSGGADADRKTRRDKSGSRSRRRDSRSRDRDNKRSRRGQTKSSKELKELIDQKVERMVER